MELDSQQISGMAGEIAALKIAVIALIKASPARDAVREHMRAQAEELIANTLPTGYSDASIQGIQLTLNLLLQHSEDRGTA